MRNVLVLYYSQSGVTRSIIESVVAPLRAAPDVNVSLHEISPAVPYPFPWSILAFLDVFPESVQGVACPLKPVACDATAAVDLVILGYQVWYLSPSIPVLSFLQSPDAKALLRGRPVVTVIGCRNMWLTAHERMRAVLADVGARLVGNIVLMDRAKNLVSVATTVLWMLSGKREPRCGLPAAGVSAPDIQGASRHGEAILGYLRGDGKAPLQETLVASGAVALVPHLLLQERTAWRAFSTWSRFIRAKGEPGDPRRALRLRLFQVCLPLAILLVSPLLFLLHHLMLPFRSARVQAEVKRFLEP